MSGLPAPVVALVILLLAAGYVSLPFLGRLSSERLRRPGGNQNSVAGRRAALLRERNAAYDEMMSLEMDYKTDKVSANDYALQRYALMAKCVEVLKQLDSLPSAREDDPLERLIAAYRQGEPLTAAAVQSTSVPAAAGEARFCAQCGAPAAAADRFCGTCGAKL